MVLKELNFDDLEFKDNEDEYEFYCEKCKSGYDNIRPQKYTSYDDYGDIIREEWLLLCPCCSNILE